MFTPPLEVLVVCLITPGLNLWSVSSLQCAAADVSTDNFFLVFICQPGFWGIALCLYSSVISQRWIRSYNKTPWASKASNLSWQICVWAGKRFQSSVCPGFYFLLGLPMSHLHTPQAPLARDTGSLSVSVVMHMTSGQSQNMWGSVFSGCLTCWNSLLNPWQSV